MREVWDVYTKDRRRTGKTCLRGEQGTLEEDEFHMWVLVWIKNARTGKYLVSQRSDDKDTDPLKWETVAGHAISGDTSLDAALREVYEEVGISLISSIVSHFVCTTSLVVALIKSGSSIVSK